MAHYAFLNENNIVTEVIPGKDEEQERHVERVAEAAWDAISAELSERIEELESREDV